jgi:arylsulfatase
MTNNRPQAPAGSPRAGVRPHVLFFICDQMQWQRQGRVDPLAYTPNLDRLADEGVFFTHIHASNGQCVPSRASMQTGLYPHEAGVMIIYGFHGHTAHLDGDRRTVGHVFRDAEYTTAYFGKMHFGTSLENLGYQHGAQGPTPSAVGEQEGPRGAAADRDPCRHSRTDQAIVDEALEFLSEHDPAQPLFLTVSVHEPHPPFELVEAFADRFPLDQINVPYSFYEDDLSDKPAFQRTHALDAEHGHHDPQHVREELRRYYTMIAHVDHLFAQVRTALEEKGMWDETAVVFASDHGDMMGAHRMRLKGTLAYDEIFRIPFTLRLPIGSPEPKRRVVDDLGVNVSLPGTLVEVAGLPLPPDFRGGSLLASLRRPTRPAQEEIFFEHYGAYWGLHPFRAIRVRNAAGEEWKFVKYYGPDADEAELYDLAADPHEVHNRVGDPELAPLRADLESRVDAWWQRTGGLDFDYYESPQFKRSGAATLIGDY